MESGYITLEEMISDIRSGNAFDLEYTSIDLRRGTGGQLKTVRNAIPAAEHYAALHEKKQGQPKNKSQKRTAPKTTIVLYIPACKEKKERMRIVHLRLITLYNGKQVL